MKLSLTIAIYHFQWWPSAILDLFGTYLDHPRRVGSWWSLSWCKIW